MKTPSARFAFFSNFLLEVVLMGDLAKAPFGRFVVRSPALARRQQDPASSMQPKIEKAARRAAFDALVGRLKLSCYRNIPPIM
ncbi:MAG TPA: hypothetical protein VE267_08840 [Bradyrhizobium sp.]|nr:hypothetical protein [Bradyrhizobium sp.]